MSLGSKTSVGTGLKIKVRTGSESKARRGRDRHRSMQMKEKRKISACWRRRIIYPIRVRYLKEPARLAAVTRRSVNAPVNQQDVAAAPPPGRLFQLFPITAA
ncbi:hypothetical protein EVAR_27728_1 [Eumeta japonica]|uniref:Uncharacterized protein n=1 Tax=Eumeta variegata TaxID=151549 RepID=A0A4C1WP62_EUMVA|nr:hypothetical protein EVAR_27728_1 [Eumeta japonica]